MEKYQAEQNPINLLYDENSDIQTGTENVLRVAQTYYEKLYTAEETDTSMQNQIRSKTTAKSTNGPKNMFNDMINLNALEYNMHQLTLGKTPRLDGLPVEFYRTFWPIIKPYFLIMTGEVHWLNLFSDSQRSGAIRLIFLKRRQIKPKILQANLTAECRCQNYYQDVSSKVM